MHARQWLWTIPVIVTVEAFLLSRYQAHESSVHFFLHSLAAVTVVFCGAVVLARKGYRMHTPTLLIVAFVLHQYAMVPDYLYSLGTPHQPWMNVFLGHLWLDDLRYHEIILPLTAVAAVGAYAATKKTV